MQKPLKRQILLSAVSFILALACWGLGSAAIAQTLPADAPSAASALDLFRTAYENRYIWDSQFPGYSATALIQQDGETYKGTIRINRDLSVEINGIESEKAIDALSRGLRMLVTHRRSTPFAIAHKEHTFSLGKTDTSGAVQVNQQGNGTPSYYQVKDKKITQVNRIMGPVAVTVDLLDAQDTPAGYLGTRYIATFKYIQTGDELDKLEFEDAYKKIGGYYIPARQIVRNLGSGNPGTTEITLTDIQLLPG